METNFSWAAIAAGALVTAAFMAGCGSSDGTEQSGTTSGVGSVQEAIVGTITNARPESLWFLPNNGDLCSGTLVAPSYFLTAAHCINYEWLHQGYVLIEAPSGALLPLVDWVIPYTGGNEDHSVDIAIGRLQAPVYTLTDDVPGADIATQINTSDLVTEVGYGDSNNDGTGAGTKRYAEGIMNTISAARNGDSGGSVFWGHLRDNGPLVGVMSARNASQNFFANPLPYKQLLYSFMRAHDLGFEVGLDRPGADLRHFSTAGSNGLDAWVCQNACDTEPQCSAFTYDDTTNICWLKNAAATTRPKAGVTTGSTHHELSSGLPHMLASFDRRGSDYTHGATLNADGCAGLCARDPQCKAFTFVDGTCWRKSSVPPVSSNSCPDCQTGSRRALEVGYNRPGSDIRSFTTSNELSCATECAKNASCLSFTYNVSSRLCYLKSEVPSPVASSNCISGIRGGMDAETERLPLPGQGNPSDPYFALNTDHPQECQADCAQSSSCVAWTYYPSIPDLSHLDPSGEPNTDFPALAPAFCQLHSIESDSFYAPGSMNVSGIKGMEFF